MTMNPQNTKNMTQIPQASTKIGKSSPTAKQKVQFVKVAILTPFTGKISALYSHTTGPKLVWKTNMYKKMKTMIVALSAVVGLDPEMSEMMPSTIKNMTSTLVPYRKMHFLPKAFKKGPAQNEAAV